MSTGDEERPKPPQRGTRKALPAKAAPDSQPSPSALLASLVDAEMAVTMRAESDAAARRIARDMHPEDMTEGQRIALYEFLHKVAYSVRYPGHYY
ncbi:MAG TPA: hypothetical protein VH478_15575 [Trebonia sp.]|jgi:hypothetical protein|nr:hypothetical protein [Trebonia sp.]